MGRQGGAGPAGGVLEVPSRGSDRLVQRPDLLARIVGALRTRERLVAVTGTGGTGKSSLAAQACTDRQVRKTFRDRIAWLDVGSQRDPVLLLAALADHLGLSQAATGLATVEQGREELMVALRDRRLLVVLDNVPDRPLLDAFTDLSATCTVLFTTRLPELATMVRAREIPVGALSEQQSLEVLARHTGQDPGTLPRAAAALCDGVGRLALGVAVIGGMAAGGRAFADVRALIADLPAGIPEAPGAAPQHRGAGAYPPGWPGRPAHAGPAPVRAAGRVRRARPFSPGRRRGVVAARSRGRRGGPIAGRVRPPVPAAHRERGLVCRPRPAVRGPPGAGRTWRPGRSAYPAAGGIPLPLPRGWAGAAADPYLAGHLAGHLHEANLGGELHAVLTDISWIQARLARGSAQELIRDYSLAGDPLTRQIRRTLRLSASSLARDPSLIRTQLAARLRDHDDPGIAAWAASLAPMVNGGGQDGPGRWLTPVQPASRAWREPAQAGPHRPRPFGARGGGDPGRGPGGERG